MKQLLVAIVLLAATSACETPSAPSGTGNVTVNGTTVDISIGGAGFTPVTVVAAAPPLGQPGFFTLSAVNAAGAMFGFAVPPNVATYAVPGAGGINVLFNDGTRTWQAAVDVGGSGSIQINSRTSTEIAGSFDITLVPLPGTAATGTKRCVGTFTAKLS